MSVRHALLGLLAQHPRHGYELHSAFEAVVGGEQNWDVKPAQIYTTLSRLAKDGLVVEDGVAQDGGPEKRVFSITPAGRDLLAQWFHTGVDAEHQRDEFFVKLMLCLATGEAPPRQVIQGQRSLLYQELHRLTAQRSRCSPKTELAQTFLYDKAIMHMEADLRWLDMIEGRLEDMSRQPLRMPEPKPRGRPKKVAT
jgi:DNA-binding PadR family transcriptional regulator